MAPIYYCFNKLRFSKQVVLSLRLYDRQYHVLGIKNNVLCSPEARIIQFLFPISIYYIVACRVVTSCRVVVSCRVVSCRVMLYYKVLQKCVSNDRKKCEQENHG